jgi:glycosyltransferase involved in cell wall biosynthesis
MNARKTNEEKLTACTVARRSELPMARVLVDSFRKFHPEIEFAVLVIDRPGEQANLPNATVFGVADLGLDGGEECRLPMLFSERELVSLLKPMFFETLLRKKAGAIVWFSPATQIFAPIPDVMEIARTASDITATGVICNEWGDYGRSFVSVNETSKPALRRWSELMRRWTGNGTWLERGNPGSLEAIFDQLPPELITPSGFGINYSNLEPGVLVNDAGGYAIGNQPLRSFDFRGYDPAKPHLLSKYLGLEPRILLSEYPDLAALCDQYREKLIGGDKAPQTTPEGSFALLPSGLRLDPRMLRIYHASLSQREDTEEEPPSPFGPKGEQGFLSWLNEPIDKMRRGVTRYMLAVHEDRADVQSVFPDPLNGDAEGFRDWYLNFGHRELELPAVLVPSQRVAGIPSPGQQPVPPVNVAGYFRAELGIGVAGRALLAALETTDIPFNTVAFDQTANRLCHPFTERHSDAGQADINIVCINPDQIGVFAEQVGPDFWNGRYTIGVWFWEAEDFPLAFHHAFNHVDEIWVASEFMRETFLKVSPKPVFKYRLPVLTPSVDRSISRAQLNLPDGFIFLFSFDFLSVLERKNPLGLIDAFCRAFPLNSGPRLVIKTINGDKRILEMEKLKYAIRKRPDIILMDGYLPAIDNATFTALADCYVSLHRSEGFGLTIAEAMALGKPVIATGYSGNLEFMTAENSYVVPARRCEVGPEREPYPADSHWSEPDAEAAARLLRHVYEQPADAHARGRCAAQVIRCLYSPAMAGNIIANRLASIRQRRIAPGPERSSGFFEDKIEELTGEIKRLRQRQTL